MAKNDPPEVQGTTLRRATYVTVEKVVNDHYDINLAKLKAELSRLRSENDPPGLCAEENHGKESADAKGTSSSIAVKEGVNAGEGSSPGMKTGPPSLNFPFDNGGSSPKQTKHHHNQNRLQPPKNGFNLCLLVGKVEVVVDKYRVDGSRVLVAEVEVGDETGSLSLRARDEQIELLQKVSREKCAIVLRNSTMELFQGRNLRLSVTKWGNMRAYPDGIASTPDPPKKINEELNFSLVDLNIVATCKVQLPRMPLVPDQNPQHKVESEPPPRSPKQKQRRYANQKKKKDHWHRHGHMSPTNPQYVLHEQCGPDQSIGRGPPAVHFPPFASSASIDTTSYTYSPSPSDQGLQHRQYHLPDDHYKRQQQLLYQQYELHQRHAHQMHMLQQQQATQRRILEQQQMTQGPISSAIPNLSRTESHESSGDFSVPSQIGGVPSSLPVRHYPATPTSQPSQQHPMSPIGAQYQYQQTLHSPMTNAMQDSRQQHGLVSPYRYQVVSPPVSPQHYYAEVLQYNQPPTYPVYHEHSSHGKDSASGPNTNEHM